MASKQEIIKEEDKFSNNIPDEEKLFAANLILHKWHGMASDRNLNGIVSDEEPDPQIENPGDVPPLNLNADQHRVYETRKRSYDTQQKDLAKLAADFRGTITENVYLYLKVATGHSLTTQLNAREMYVHFREIFVVVCEEDLDKVYDKLRTLFIKGESVTTHIMNHMKYRDQITHARGQVATGIQIDELMQTLRSINTADTHKRTIGEIRAASAAEVLELEAPERAFTIFTKNLMKADREKSFGEASSAQSRTNRVSHDKVDVSASKIDMVKTVTEDDKFDKLLKVLEVALSSNKTGGGKERSRPKIVFSMRASEAAREKHKDCDLRDDCPVHPGHGRFRAGHTWGECGFYLGKEYKPSKGKKN
jgi:hypothetical protein